MLETSNHQKICDILIAAQRLLGDEGAAHRLKTLPIAPSKECQNGWHVISLPQWASDLVPQGQAGLLVPKWGNAPVNWKTYDWWRGAHALLFSEWEKKFEQEHVPIHSYSVKLGAKVQPIFDHAWVNRIVLFLRRWWALENDANEEGIFGPLPQPKLHLTHDLDAIAKTLPIRIKQAVFCTYNLQAIKALRFMFLPGNYWQFKTIMDLERAHSRQSLWNIYGGQGGWSRPPKEILMDPFYDVSHPKLVEQLKEMLNEGHKIGLHPKFDSWQEGQKIQAEKEKIEKALSTTISHVRQHWLRFSFHKTWQAQAKAGLQNDMTLGFNDRSGFRNSAALTFKDKNSAMNITPMVLMDSHLFDYSQSSKTKRHNTIKSILTELKQTGGEASVIWHQRVFHADYGWGQDYAYLLKQMDEMGFIS